MLMCSVFTKMPTGQHVASPFPQFRPVASNPVDSSDYASFQSM